MSNNYEDIANGLAQSYTDQLTEAEKATTKITASYNPKTNNYEVIFSGDGGQVTLKYDATDVDSYSKAVVTFPGTNGGGTLNAVFQKIDSASKEAPSHVSNLTSPTDVVIDIKTGKEIIDKTYVYYPGMNNAIDNDIIRPCVSITAKTSSDTAVELAETALRTFSSVNTDNTPFENIVTVSQSAGTHGAQRFITNIANDENYSGTQIIAELHDDKGSYTDLPKDTAFLEASTKENVTVIAFPSKTWGGQTTGDRFRLSFPNITKANTNGGRILIAKLDYNYYRENGGLDGIRNYDGESHMTTVYLAINHGEVNSNLEGKIFSDDLHYVLTLPVNENGVNVEYLINPETIEILENSDLSPEEKSLYYNMKTKYNFVNDSQISVEYQNIIGQIENIVNNIADNFEMVHINTSDSLQNKRLKGMFEKSSTFVNSSNLLDYRIKERLYAAGLNVSNIAQTEATLAKLAEEMLSTLCQEKLFGTTSEETDAFALTELGRNNTLICAPGDEIVNYSPSQIGNFSTSDLEALKNSGLFEYLSKEIDFSAKLTNDLTAIQPSGAVTGDSWGGFFSELMSLASCSTKRGECASHLLNVYQDVYDKLSNFFASRGYSELKCSTYPTVIANIRTLRAQKAYWEAKAKEVVYSEECDDEGNCTTVETHPYAAQAAAALAMIEPALDAALQLKADMEEFTLLMNDCNREIAEAEAYVQTTYSEIVATLGDLVNV